MRGSTVAQPPQIKARIDAPLSHPDPARRREPTSKVAGADASHVRSTLPTAPAAPPTRMIARLRLLLRLRDGRLGGDGCRLGNGRCSNGRRRGSLHRLGGALGLELFARLHVL